MYIILVSHTPTLTLSHLNFVNFSIHLNLCHLDLNNSMSSTCMSVIILAQGSATTTVTNYTSVVFDMIPMCDATCSWYNVQ